MVKSFSNTSSQTTSSIKEGINGIGDEGKERSIARDADNLGKKLGEKEEKGRTRKGGTNERRRVGWVTDVK